MILNFIFDIIKKLISNPLLNMSNKNNVITDEKKIEEILTKGVKDIFPGKEELKGLMLSGKKLRLYTGIDPTANFIHMGHMIWMRKLSEFQKLGHEVIFLIGGFTAMIGDPDKKYSREPLTREQVQANFTNYKSDASKFLDFDQKENPVKIMNNFDWLSTLNLEKWIEIMSNVTLQHLLSHDMFKERLEAQTPIRLHEIMYPLMQGYDSVAMEVDLEVGGSDQTFNMLTGRILSKNLINKEKYVLSLKLLTDNSGKKMGKTTNNAISFKDSANDVYGKVMSFSDQMLADAYELLSPKSFDEIKEIQKQISQKPMQLKKDLAFELAQIIHNTKAAEDAAKNFEEVVQNKEIPTDIPTIDLDKIRNKKISDIAASLNLVSSKGEFKRLLTQGGIKLNDSKIEDEDIDLKPGDVLKIGKRKWLKIN
jgi:tyrosyl-tRNA synthetase